MRTFTGTYTINGETYSYTIEAPDAAVFIYSRHVFCKVTIKDSDSYPVVNRKIRISVGVEFVFEKYTKSDGSIMFDIARTLQIQQRQYYSDVKHEVDLTYNVTNKLALTNTANITFYDVAVGTTHQFRAFSIETLNGANDIIDKFWYQANRRLRWFRNYPATFDFQNINGNVSLSINGATAQSTAFPYVSTQRTYIMARINPKRWFSNVRDFVKATIAGTSKISFDEDGNLTDSINSVTLIADNSDFDLKRKCYLRWIGKHGEVFYWLFKKYSVKDSITRETQRMAYIPDTFNSYGILENEELNNYGKETSLVVYSCPVDDFDFETLQSIINSPVVDMLVSYRINTTPSKQEGEEEEQQGGDENEREGEGNEETNDIGTEENEGDDTEKETEGDGDDNTDAGDYIEDIVKWQRVTVEKGNYTTVVTDRHAVNKQLVLTLAMPKEGGLLL